MDPYRTAVGSALPPVDLRAVCLVRVSFTNERCYILLKQADRDVLLTISHVTM